MFRWHEFDWTATAAWAQAILSALAIFAAVRLQDRERRLAKKDRTSSRYLAVLAIADNCVGTLNQLNTRARDGDLTIAKYGFYRDETTADLTAVAAIDLSQIDDPEFSTEIMKLRRLMTTARRRLRLMKGRLVEGKTVSKDRFRSLHKQATHVVDRIRTLQASKEKG